jgi:hypothetical protein
MLVRRLRNGQGRKKSSEGNGKENGMHEPPPMEAQDIFYFLRWFFVFLRFLIKEVDGL